MSTGTLIRIRMYRVGFGDCFLLSLPTSTGMEHVLIDCGVHPRGDIGTMGRVVNDIALETNKKLALVIATHAHMDHVSGFAAYQDVFRQFQVREVWLPWTENPQDPDAARLKTKHTSLVQALIKHFTSGGKPLSDPAMAALDNLKDDDGALNFLRAGINGGRVSYLEAERHSDNIAGINGLSASVLGPPRDDKFLAQMDPPVDERFLRATADDAWEVVREIQPFDDTWTVKDDSNRYYAAINETDKNLLAVAATSSEMLAFTLDQIVNNTSIVVLFTFSGKHLLFAGDAQYGNWKSWIEHPESKTDLAELHFYKVAHHGSLNATPKSALDAMPQGSFAAMVSTQSKPWASIPQANLMTALAARACGVVRSDSIPIEGAPKGPSLAQLPAGFQKGPFWFDYFLAG